MVADSKQRALLEAAARILATDGPEALTMRRVAGEIGTSTMAVYTWYGGKAGLLRAVYLEAFTRFGDRLRAERQGDDPLADLLRLGRGYRDHALADPNLYAVMFGRVLGAWKPEAEDEEVAAGTFLLLLEAVERCVAAGVLTGEPAAVAMQIWAAVHGAVSLEVDAPPEDPAGAGGTYWNLIRTVLVGLGAPPERLAAAGRLAGVPLP